MTNSIDNGSTSLADAMRALTYGELKPHAVGGFKSGAIQESDYPEVLEAINRGINQIQIDLQLNEGSVRIKLLEGVVTYRIHSRHSLVTGSADDLYVDDSTYMPFMNDILKINQVFDVQGNELPINRMNVADSIFIPEHNVIQHPFPKEGEVLGVTYTRLSTRVVATTLAEAQTTYLPIPDYTLLALYAYVGGVMTAGITTPQEISDSNNAFSKYAQLIAHLKLNPMIQEESYVNTKLIDNGFI